MLVTKARKRCATCRKAIKWPRIKFCSESCSNGVIAGVKLGKCEICGKGIRGATSRACHGNCTSALIYRNYIKKWKQGLVCGTRGPGIVSNHVRRYLLETRGECCELCGWNKRNPVTGRVPIEVHHDNGDPENNTEENLKLLCPNCHALTPNFRALNTGSGRVGRRKQSAA